MNIWLTAAAALLVCLGPCAWGCLHGKAIDRLVALELTSVVVAMILVALSEGYGRPAFLDLPLTLALLAFAGGLVFARFIERWM